MKVFFGKYGEWKRVGCVWDSGRILRCCDVQLTDVITLSPQTLRDRISAERVREQQKTSVLSDWSRRKTQNNLFTCRHSMRKQPDVTKNKQQIYFRSVCFTKPFQSKPIPVTHRSTGSKDFCHRIKTEKRNSDFFPKNSVLNSQLWVNIS